MFAGSDPERELFDRDRTLSREFDNRTLGIVPLNALFDRSRVINALLFSSEAGIRPASNGFELMFTTANMESAENTSGRVPLRLFACKFNAVTCVRSGLQVTPYLLVQSASCVLRQKTLLTMSTGPRTYSIHSSSWHLASGCRSKKTH